MKPFKTVDFDAAQSNLEKLKVHGKIKPAEFRRLSKGIANIEKGQDQGFAYDVDSRKGTFTAKNEAGEDARGKSGGVSGLNFIEGRKTSKALSYLSKFAKTDRSGVAAPIGAKAEREPGTIRKPDIPRPFIPERKPDTQAQKIRDIQDGIAEGLKGYETEMPVFSVPETVPSQSGSVQENKPSSLPGIDRTKSPSEMFRDQVSKGISRFPRQQTGSEPKPKFTSNQQNSYALISQLEKEKKIAKQRNDLSRISEINAAISREATKSGMQYSNGKILREGRWLSPEEFFSEKKEGGQIPMANDGIKIQRPKIDFSLKPFRPPFNPNPVPAVSSPQLSGTNPQVPPTPETVSRMDGEGLISPDKGMVMQDRAVRPIDKFSAINTGLGVFGAASALTAKEPRIRKTPRYNAVIRPFSGDQEQLDQTLSSIDQSATAASNDIKTGAGSNTTAYLTGRSMVQSNTNRAKADAYLADGQIRRADRDRFDRQLEEENRINYQNEVADQKEKEARDLARYQARVSTAQGMMQQSLNYSNAKNADEKNKAVQLKMVEERMKSIKDASKYNVLYSAISRGGIESLTPELKAAYDELMGLPSGRNGMKLSYFKKGGKIGYPKRDNMPEKLLSDANKDLKRMMLNYSAFVSKASRGQMNDFQQYVREINKTSRVNIKRN